MVEFEVGCENEEERGSSKFVVEWEFVEAIERPLRGVVLAKGVMAKVELKKVDVVGAGGRLPSRDVVGGRGGKKSAFRSISVERSRSISMTDGN